MKARTKKKRGQAKKIESLERGNRYLADVVGRLMQEKLSMENGYRQPERMLEGYMMVMVNDAGGEVGIDKEVLERMMRENYMVCERREDGSVWFTVLEYDEEEGADDGKSD
jgi:hypothetical protein